MKTYVIGVALTLAVLIGLFLAALHLGFQAPRRRERGTPGSLGLAYETVYIPTVSGKQLFAWLLPVPGASTGIIILHGWGGNAERMLPMALPFHQAGINVLLIDARNHGNSDADSFSSMPRFAEDLDHAIDWLRQHHPERTQSLALLGHSVGAGAALLTASKRRDIAAVISVSVFAHPEWMMKRHLQRLRLPNLVMDLVLNYVQWIIGRRFGEIAPMSTAGKIACPILLVHGRADTTVPVEDARIIAQSCPEADLTLLEIDAAEHDSVDKIEQHGFELVGFLRRQGFAASHKPPPRRERLTRQNPAMFAGKKALLLDMNGTFMFGEDRFGDSEDFSVRYFKVGGTLAPGEISRIIRATYGYLDVRYPDENYRHRFPSVESAIRAAADVNLDREEIRRIVDTFAFHELGYIPSDYVTALHELRQHFTLAAVIDIWSPKKAWLDTFERAGISGLFSAMSFSSDHGMVKPSPKPFELVLSQLGITNTEAIVVGDSPRRDLGGAKSAGIDCILVGGSEHPEALKSFRSLLDLCDAI